MVETSSDEGWFRYDDRPPPRPSWPIYGITGHDDAWLGGLTTATEDGERTVACLINHGWYGQPFASVRTFAPGAPADQTPEDLLGESNGGRQLPGNTVVHTTSAVVERVAVSAVVTGHGHLRVVTVEAAGQVITVLLDNWPEAVTLTRIDFDTAAERRKWRDIDLT